MDGKVPKSQQSLVVEKQGGQAVYHLYFGLDETENCVAVMSAVALALFLSSLALLAVPNIDRWWRSTDFTASLLHFMFCFHFGLDSLLSCSLSFNSSLCL